MVSVGRCTIVSADQESESACFAVLGEEIRVKSIMRSFRESKRTQFLLIVLAALVSLLPLTAEKRQGNSIRWSVDGEEIRCEYFQLPSFSHIRTYDLTKLEGVTRSADSRNESVDVVRLRLNGLNLNIPSQSSELIWNFDSYVVSLQDFVVQAQHGDQSAAYSWYHPWLLVGAVSAFLAVALWVLVFWVLLTRSTRNAEPSNEA